MITVDRAQLHALSGSSDPAREVELRFDTQGFTQLADGSAWQVPWRACRDLRAARRGVRFEFALSIGVLRYRYDFAEENVHPSAAELVELLTTQAGARPIERLMSRGSLRP